MLPFEPCRVAVPEWQPGDGLARMFAHELAQLGYAPVKFPWDGPVPEDIGILLTFAPFDKILPIWRQAAERWDGRRPVVMHWNTEGMPDLRIPLPIMSAIGALRSALGRMTNSPSVFKRFEWSRPPFRLMDSEMMRFRHVGDYEYAYRKGWLHLLFDTSQIYCRLRSQQGVPTQYAPWGATRIHYDDLRLERDIDVLWMGARGTSRRSRILDKVCGELRASGVKVHVADNKESPYIFYETRTKYLNRAKITLNVTRTWYDDNFSRFSLAAPNRSMIISEPILPHCLEFKEDVHYVSAAIPDLPKTIMYYLEHEQDRQRITENAFHLMTTELQFSRTLKSMLEAAASCRPAHAAAGPV